MIKLIIRVKCDLPQGTENLLLKSTSQVSSAATKSGLLTAFIPPIRENNGTVLFEVPVSHRAVQLTEFVIGSEISNTNQPLPPQLETFHEQKNYQFLPMKKAYNAVFSQTKALWGTPF